MRNGDQRRCSQIRVGIHTGLCVLCFSCLGGCNHIFGFGDNTSGYMTTQSGERVSVQRDIWGNDYYYERGAKVWVNEGGPTRAPDRPTSWYGR